MEDMAPWIWAAAVAGVLLYALVPAIRHQADREVRDMINDPVRTIAGSLMMAMTIFAVLALIFWIMPG
jgi:cellobiose-specific phosphotransferase system component IIC